MIDVNSIDPAAWVHTAKEVRLPLPFYDRLPAYLPLGFLVGIIFMNWITFFANVAVVSVFVHLDSKGRSPLWVFRRLICKSRGQLVHARSPMYLRRRNRPSFSQFSIPRAREVIDDVNS